MTLKINSAESGLASGTNLTQGSTGNSGGSAGDFFVQVSPGTGGTIAYASAQKAHGSLSHLFTTAAGVLGFVIMQEPNPSTNFSVSFYVYLTGYPSAETIFVDVQGTAGGTCSRLHMTAAGIMKAHNGAGTLIAGTTATSAIPLNTWTRIDLWGTVNASTGTVNWGYFAMDSTTPIESFSATNVNTASASATAGRVAIGKFSTTTMAPFYVDDYKINLESAAAPTPWQAPTLTLTGSINPTSGPVPTTVATLTLVSTGGNGNPKSYEILDWGDGTSSAPQSSPVFTKTYTTARPALAYSIVARVSQA